MIVGFKARATVTDDPEVSPFRDGTESIAGNRIMTHSAWSPCTASLTNLDALGALRPGGLEGVVAHAFRGRSGALTDGDRAGEVRGLRVESAPPTFSDGFDTIVGERRLAPVDCVRAGWWYLAPPQYAPERKAAAQTHDDRLHGGPSAGRDPSAVHGAATQTAAVGAVRRIPRSVPNAPAAALAAGATGHDAVASQSRWAGPPAIGGRLGSASLTRVMGTTPRRWPDTEVVPTLSDDAIAALTADLAPLDADLTARFPGDPGTRQPVHTCYLPADRLHPDVVLEWGEAAREALRHHAPDPDALAAATAGDSDPAIAAAVYAHVVQALTVEPIQDLRVDLEDGYGTRPDEVEDADAVQAAQALRTAAAAGALPASYGLRPKSLDAAVRARGLRSLDLFLTTLAGDGGEDGPPPGLVVTLPKVSAPEQVIVFSEVLAELERQLGIPPVALEIQVETPAAVLSLPALAGAAPGRLTGLHVGTYDYSAALGIAAEYQASDHPGVELATALMQLAAAGTGIRVADGSSNVLPVGRASDVRSAWRRHAGLVRRAWSRGLYQGWDLHPGQLVSRHAAVAGCLLTGLPDALRRLADYAAARTSGSVADEPATARALAGHVLRAVDARLVDDARLRAAGLDEETVARLGGRPPQVPA
ncbi:HpcH/HpaI aldolase (Modular protein) [Frankia sp. Hr75.2]|nr:HpcH/HpaI aldolase (Modular protein) [Frankia sp. Hr75.2]